MQTLRKQEVEKTFSLHCVSQPVGYFIWWKYSLVAQVGPFLLANLADLALQDRPDKKERAKTFNSSLTEWI